MVSSLLPASVRIVEVGPRDGLQNEKTVVPTNVKVIHCNSLFIFCDFPEVTFNDLFIPSNISSVILQKRYFNVTNFNLSQVEFISKLAEAGLTHVEVIT